MMEDSGSFELLEQRKRIGQLSATTAVAGAIVAAFLIWLNGQHPLFSGKGSSMGPILIVSGVFVVVVGVCLAIPSLVRQRGD